MIKVAERSFSAFQKTNMPSTERSFYLLKTRTICVIFLYNCMQCIDDLYFITMICYKIKEPSNFQLLFVTERTQLNATHAQLLEILRPALAETYSLLAIQSLEFQETWHKNRSETTWMIYHEKSEFWHREFLTIQEKINGELRKSPMSKFY